MSEQTIVLRIQINGSDVSVTGSPEKVEDSLVAVEDKPVNVKQPETVKKTEHKSEYVPFTIPTTASPYKTVTPSNFEELANKPHVPFSIPTDSSYQEKSENNINYETGLNMTETRINRPIHLMVFITLMVLVLFGWEDNGEYTLHLFYPPAGGFHPIQGLFCGFVGGIPGAFYVFNGEELNESDSNFLKGLIFISIIAFTLIVVPLPA